MADIPMHPTRDEVSAAAHAQLPHANPLAPEQMDELVARVAPRRPRTALDIGCGPGAFAVTLAREASVRVRAVEPNGLFVERGREAAGRSTLKGGVDFEQRALRDDEGLRFDAVICIGASSAIGTLDEALQRCHGLMAEGGVLVFADLVWSAEPPPEFLAFLGGDTGAMWRREDAAARFASRGLRVEWSCSASAAAWSRYERAVLAGRLELADRVGGEAGAALRERARAWFRAFEAHGSACFGFDAFVAV